MSKLLWARIGMTLVVSDEDFEKIKNESTDWYNGSTHDYVLTDELAQRFVREGEQDGDSYIPGDWFEDPAAYEWEDEE